MKPKNKAKPTGEGTRYYVYPTSDTVNQAVAEALTSGQFGSFSSEPQQVTYQNKTFPAFEIPRHLAVYLLEGKLADQCSFLSRRGNGEYRKWSLKSKNSLLN